MGGRSEAEPKLKVKTDETSDALVPFVANLITTSKALVNSSDALVPSENRLRIETYSVICYVECTWGFLNF